MNKNNSINEYDNCAEDVISWASERYQDDYYEYRIQIKEEDFSSYNGKLCMLYVSSIEINIGYELTRPLPAEAQTCSDSFVINIYNKGDSYTSDGANFIKNISDALKNCYDTSDSIFDAYSPPLRLNS